MSSDVVWYVQLPHKYKSLFERLAEEGGDMGYGRGARELKRFLNKNLGNKQSREDQETEIRNTYAEAVKEGEAR